MNVHHRPRKRLSQHFLHDPNIIRKIIAAIDPLPGQTLFEIGPGKGALTLPLLERAGELYVVEKDPILAQYLIEHCKGWIKFHIYVADVMKFDFCQFGKSSIRVFGNLPYNISTPLLFHLLDSLECINDMVFMLQDEVIERITAPPGNKTYGRLSVMIQSRCKVKKLFKVNANAFSPVPKVNSAVIKLTPLETMPIEETQYPAFEKIVRFAFNQRRKTIRNALKELLTEQQIRSLGIDPASRAEKLTITDYVALANIYHSNENQRVKGTV